MRNSLLAILFILIVLTVYVACDTQEEPTLEDNSVHCVDTEASL
jgi:hypothetical protein